MKTLALAGVAGLTALGAQAQLVSPTQSVAFEPVVVTATRALADPPPPTLRDTVVITREDLDAATPLSLAEALQRFAGVEFRSNGGPGQTTGLFLRGTGSAQALVLVDGLRVGSATTGSTAVENIPLDMIERIEVVKGPLSGLWGSDAIGGVVQVFTRGKKVPHLFATAAYGSDNDRRASAGLATADEKTQVSISAGLRRVDAPSASNSRAPFGYDPDRDPHENYFGNVRATQRLWTGEVLSLEAFGSRSRTYYDGGSPNDRNTQTLEGVKLSSSSEFLPWWLMRLGIGYSADKQKAEGGQPSLFETRQTQGSFINEFRTATGSALLGLDGNWQEVRPEHDPSGATVFDKTKRDTWSYFGSLNEMLGTMRVEGNARHEKDDQFGSRTTGSASLGTLLFRDVTIAGTYAEGFRAPSFNDLYLVQFRPAGPGQGGYLPNPDLRPERSRSTEVTLKSAGKAAWQWRVTGFDNKLDDLITFNTDAEFVTRVANVARARVRGVEVDLAGTWLGVRWRAQATWQQPRDEDTDKRLQQRAERFGALEATTTWKEVTFGANVVASGDRFDSPSELASSRLGGYARLDLRARYAPAKHWSVEVALTNVLDKRYETALGYDAPRRGALLNVRFEAF